MAVVPFFCVLVAGKHPGADNLRKKLEPAFRDTWYEKWGLCVQQI